MSWSCFGAVASAVRPDAIMIRSASGGSGTLARFYLNKDWGCVILRDIDFLLKFCWSIPCLHPSWRVLTWIARPCAAWRSQFDDPLSFTLIFFSAKFPSTKLSLFPLVKMMSQILEVWLSLASCLGNPGHHCLAIRVVKSTLLRVSYGSYCAAPVVSDVNQSVCSLVRVCYCDGNLLWDSNGQRWFSCCIWFVLWQLV